MNRVLRGKYYGTPIYLRFENRANSLTVIFSYRESGRIVYEHPPRVVPAAMKELLSNSQPTGDKDSGQFEHLENVADKQIKDFFWRMLTVDAVFCKNEGKKLNLRDAGLQRRCDLQDLTLGAMIAADYNVLLYGEEETKRSPETIADDKRTIELLLKKEGNTLWREVSTERCGKWLIKESTHKRKAVKRLMNNLLGELCAIGAVEGMLGWDTYDAVGETHHRKSFDSSMRENIKPTMLTYKQCAALFPPYGADGKIHATPVDAALVLMATLGLDEEEICALDRKDFEPLSNFSKRLTVNINEKYVKRGGKNCKTVRIEDANERRKLPLSVYATNCINSLFSKKAPEDTPLIPRPTNAKRRMSPETLKDEIKNRVEAVTSADGIKEGKLKTSAQVKLKNTARRELANAGAEAEELRFIEGQAGKLVSARYYADYYNESEQNRLGSMQDRWLKKVVSTAPVDGSRISKNGHDATCYNSSMEYCTKARIELSLPPDAEGKGDLELVLGAKFGFVARINFEEERI